MRRYTAGLLLLPMMLAGCGPVGDKSASLSAIYGVTAVLALLMLIAYCCIFKKKDPWFLLLFASVLVVNAGYLALAVSENLSQALFANRLAYLGSVFLPLSMLMIILRVCNIQYRKWLPYLLVGVSVLVFLVAASPGYLDIYYKEVTFQKIDGVTVLNKVYGPLHVLYLLYLLGHFAAMVTTIVHATATDKLESVAYAALLAVAVFVNIGVWLIEQLVRIDFEILSVSYIISESFLLGLRLLIAETERKKLVTQRPEQVSDTDNVTGEQLEAFAEGLTRLTPKEREIYGCYCVGMSTAQIMEKLQITENTLKFHNKNLYGKLGVSSRRQLVECYRTANKQK